MFIMPLTATMVTDAVKVSHILYDGTMAGASKIHFDAPFPDRLEIHTCQQHTAFASTVSYSVMHKKDHSVPGIEQQEPLRSTLVPHSPVNRRLTLVTAHCVLTQFCIQLRTRRGQWM